MVSISSLNVISTANLPRIQQSDAIKAALQRVEAAIATDAADSSASGARTNLQATGFTATPRLSADVVAALISNQSQNSADSASSTNLAGAPPEQVSTESQTATSPDPSSPPTLQQIAQQFDLHHVTHQQEEQVIGDLVSSGKLSQTDGFRLFDQTVLADAFNSQHYRIVNGQFVATTPSPPGTIIGNDAPGGPQYDLVQRVQQSLAADQSFGDSANAAKDQRIIDVLNQLDTQSNGTTG